MACSICCPNKININIISIPTKFRSPGGENTHVNSRQNWCCSIIAYGEKTSLTANVGTNAHNIYEIAITTAILIGRFRIANLPNFFSNFTKKLKLNFPHFHFAYQFDIIPYIHKKAIATRGFSVCGNHFSHTLLSHFHQSVSMTVFLSPAESG